MVIKMWIAEIIFSVIMIGLAIVFWVWSGDIGGSINPADVGAAAFPRLALAIICICAAAQIILSIRTKKKLMETGDKGKEIAFDNSLNMIVAVAVMLVYGYLMPVIGFFYTTPIAVFAMMFVMGNRKYIQMLTVTAGFMIFVYVIFIELLRVSLP